MAGVKEFEEKIRADKVFAKKFENAKTPGDVVSLAGQEGFSFTVDDLVDALEDALKNRELTEAELDAVAGGGSVNSVAYRDGQFWVKDSYAVVHPVDLFTLMKML